jgi:hypothetical protein
MCTKSEERVPRLIRFVGGCAALAQLAASALEFV